MSATVLIVDDHATFRASLRRVLEAEGFDVVGEAADGASGVDLARQLEPEVVILDIVLPDLTGFEVAELLAEQPTTVILTSSRDAADFGTRLEETPAAGFLSKDRLSGDALRTLLQGAA